jgi:putative pyruvate formate lyase activating enzyme
MSGTFEPGYLEMERIGELAAREEELRAYYADCRLCPRACHANRTAGEAGTCRAPGQARVCAAHPHFGEEPELVGVCGSGTIFFSHCNLLCVYCQNWDIAHRGDGEAVSDADLASLMLALQARGCHNINLVTPTPYVPSIVGALRQAVELGLRAPLVYNTGTYDSLEVIRLLDGIVDIYLPDFKYTDGEKAAAYSSSARDYPEVAAAVIAEMHRQVGDLVTDHRGIARRGLMIRHLVLPENIAGTADFAKFVAERLSRDTYVNVMGQYRPEHRAWQYPELSRRITSAEYRQALAWAAQQGLTRAA